MGTVGGAEVTSVPPMVHIGTAEGIAILVRPDGQPVVTTMTTTHTNSSANPGNTSLGDDPASMAAAGGQVGFATVAGMAAAGRGRKRRNAAPGGGTKRRAIGNVVSPQPAIPDVLDQCVATTTIMGMPLPVLVAGTAAAAIAKKNGQGPYVKMVPTATHGTFRLLTPATGAPSPPRMQLPPYPNTVNSNAIVDPPARIPIAHTQYHPPSAPTPAPGTSHPQGIP